MGADKARLELDGRSLLERAAGALAAVAPTCILAPGPQARYAELGLPLALDRRPDLGPLGGLEAALSWMHDAGLADGWLLALACDMPCATPEAFRALLAEADGADACLLAGARGPEPLFAVYRAGLLAAVREALDAGERRMVSFHADRPGGPRVRVLPARRLGEEGERLLANLNTPEDLARAGRTVRGGLCA